MAGYLNGLGSVGLGWVVLVVVNGMHGFSWLEFGGFDSVSGWEWEMEAGGRV